MKPTTVYGALVVGALLATLGCETPPPTDLAIASQATAALTTGALVFPVRGYSARTAPLAGVFDHSARVFYKSGRDGVVIPFTGVRADQSVCSPAFGPEYGIASNASLIITFGTFATYVGTSCGAARASYDGHPGYDYVFGYDTEVIAAISGTVRYDSPPAGLSSADHYNALTIDNGKGLVVRYLHLATWWDASRGQVRHRKKDGTIETCTACPKQGATINAGLGLTISYVGSFAPTTAFPNGQWGGVNPHLHVEVVQSASVVDPYGWQGTCSDPYPGGPSTNLWDSKTDRAFARFSVTGTGSSVTECMSGVVGSAIRGKTMGATLDATRSTATSGKVVSQLWVVDHQYVGSQLRPVVQLEPGAHTVSLTVTTDGGLVSTAESQIGVAEVQGCGPTVIGGTGTDSSRNISGEVDPGANQDACVAVASVSLSPTSASLNVGSSVQLTATAKNASGASLADRPMSFATNNVAAATVSGGGLVTAVGAGVATVTASTEGKSATAIITVTQQPGSVASVIVSPSQMTIGLGGNGQLTVTPADSAGMALKGRVINISSSDSTIAVVTNAGVVTARAPGTVTITVSCEAKTASAVVTVLKPAGVAAVLLTPDSLKLAVGDTGRVTATMSDSTGAVLGGRTVAFASSDTTVAKTTNAGFITAYKAGKATITAISEGKTGTASVVVDKATVKVAFLALLPDTLKLLVGASGQITTSVADSTGAALTDRTVTFSSSDSTVAKVTTTGLITAAKAGTATVTATCEGRTAKVAVIITQPPAKVAAVSIHPDTLRLIVGGSGSFKTTVKDASGAILDREVAYLSSNAEVATVSRVGVAKGVAVGTSKIMATSDGVSASGVVVVNQPDSVVALTISPVHPVLFVGDSVQLIATISYKSGATTRAEPVIWASSNPPSVLISQSTGMVKVIGAGGAKISATAAGVSVSDSISVSVPPALDTTVVNVTLAPPKPSIVIGDSLQLVATATNKSGKVLSNKKALWLSTAPWYLAVSQAGGLAVGISEGGAAATATIDGVSATDSVTVTKRPILVVSPLVLDYSVPSNETNKVVQHSVTVSNDGGGELIWSAESSSSRFQIGRTSGIGPATWTFQMDASGVAIGQTVSGTITFTAVGASNGPQVMKISLRVY